MQSANEEEIHIGPSTLVRMTWSKSVCVTAFRAGARVPETPALQTSTSMLVPANRFDAAVTSATCVTSIFMTSAPAWASSWAASGLRQQPITRQPAPAYCRANSRPNPRFAPVISATGMTSGKLDGERGRFTAADAQARHAPLLAQLAQGSNQGHVDARAGRADGMPERARAAVDI